MEDEERTLDGQETPRNASLDGADDLSTADTAVGDEASSVHEAVQAGSSTRQTDERSAQTSPPAATRLPSYSPLAVSNYPPLWSGASTQKAQPKPSTATDTPRPDGASLDTLRAVLSTTSSTPDRKPSKSFQLHDPTNQHEHMQRQHTPYSHAKFNVFGMDLGPWGKPPSLGLGSLRKSSKKK